MTTIPNHLLRHSYMDYTHLNNLYCSARSGEQHTMCEEFNALSPSLQSRITDLIALAVTGSDYILTEIGEVLRRRRAPLSGVDVVSSFLPLQQAIQKIAFDAFDYLPRSEANFVAGRMYAHCGSPSTRDLKWGAHHAKDEDKVEALLRSLTDDAANELENCLVYAQPFVEGLTYPTLRRSIPTLRASILESIQKLPSDQREEILTHVQHLVAYLGAPLHQTLSSIAHPNASNNLLYVIAAIPQDKRAAFLEDIKPLLRDADRLLQQNHNGCDWMSISQLLSNATFALLHERASWSLPQEQRAVIFNKIAQVLPFNCRSHTLSLICQEMWSTMTRDLEREAHPTLLLQLLDLIAEEPSPLHRTGPLAVIMQARSLTLIEAIRAMPADERQKLLHMLLDYPRNRAAEVLHCIIAMPAEERMDIIALLATICHDLRMNVVTCLSKFSAEERKVFLVLLERIKAQDPRAQTSGDPRTQQLINIIQLPEENRLSNLLRRLNQ